MSSPRVVVLGTGFGGLEAAFYLRWRMGGKPAITIVSNRDDFHFKPNTIYIPFGNEPKRYVIPLRPAFAKRGIDFKLSQVTGVDPNTKEVLTDQGSVPYDFLVIATGATMSTDEVPGLAEFANTIWDSEQMLRLRQSISQLITAARSGQRRRVLFVVPPNNKCSGPLYEIVLMLDTWLRRNQVRAHVDILYATFERSYIQAFGPRLHDVVEKEFDRRGIAGFTQRVVSRVDPGTVSFQHNGTETYDLLISYLPYVATLRYAALPSDDRGFLKTDLATRQVQGCPDIYAVGDAADFPVKQAFLAMLQADAAAEHIAQRILEEVPTAAFDPVSMCIMEQFDQGTFAQVPLDLTGDPALPVRVRESQIDQYQVGTGVVWRAGKKLLGTVLPYRFRNGLPFHAGKSWTIMESGLKMMAKAFAD